MLVYKRVTKILRKYVIFYYCMAVSMPIIFGRPQVAYIYFTCYAKAHRWYILCTLWLKGGGHGHFHIAFFGINV